MSVDNRAALYPIGSSVIPEDLARDPYPIYARMQSAKPISWVAALGMYYAVRYQHVQDILKDPGPAFQSAPSTRHSSIPSASTCSPWTMSATSDFAARSSPISQRARYAASWRRSFAAHVDHLLEGFKARKRAEMRSAFASRLPILTMLSLFGLPGAREPEVRAWYDSFEAALANFEWNNAVRETARERASVLPDDSGRHRSLPP